MSPPLCTTPNQHARPAALELTPSSATFRGYQEFVLTRHGIHVAPGDELLARKDRLLRHLFESELLRGQTVLDLGANSAFFSFLALQNGATRATAVDIDPTYLANVDRAARALGFDALVTERRNVAEWQDPADIVVALALVHWLHNCTATFGSVAALVQHLAALTRRALIVEWVDPDDSAIRFFGHLEWHSAQPGPYEPELFERELSAHFSVVASLGEVSPTRRLLLALKDPADMDRFERPAGDANRMLVCEVESLRRTLIETELALAAAERARADASRDPGHAEADVASLHERLAANPDYALAYAAALRRANDPAAALAVVTRVLASVSAQEDVARHVLAEYMFGSLCRELNRHEEALEAFERILCGNHEQIPSEIRGGALYHSALLLEHRGELREARRRLEECLVCVKNHEAARSALLRLSTSTDRTADRGHPARR